MVTHLSTRQTQFSYFDQMLGGPVWKGRKVLDFGGNVGGFLAGAGDHVDHDDYWCLDLTRAQSNKAAAPTRALISCTTTATAHTSTRTGFATCLSLTWG